MSEKTLDGLQFLATYFERHNLNESGQTSEEDLTMKGMKNMKESFSRSAFGETTTGNRADSS